MTLYRRRLLAVTNSFDGMICVTGSITARTGFWKRWVEW